MWKVDEYNGENKLYIFNQIWISDEKLFLNFVHGFIP